MWIVERGKIKERKGNKKKERGKVREFKENRFTLQKGNTNKGMGCGCILKYLIGNDIFFRGGGSGMTFGQMFRPPGILNLKGTAN
jgi:hypothetical protein